MDTLIELYDERAIENTLGPEMFRPKRVIYLCTSEIMNDKNKRNTLARFFRERGLFVELEFVECSLYKADQILRQLLKIAGAYPDCTLDITGGTDAALFAAGMFCNLTGTPAFTYSRRKKCFYDIQNAPFADNLPCTLQYSVEDFFKAAGGTLRKGRADNRNLASYTKYCNPFFAVYLKHRRKWADFITFMTRISQNDLRDGFTPEVSGSCTQKGDRGSTVKADEEILTELAEMGFLKNLKLIPETSVSFSFKDAQIRSWLRDVGSALELYVYKACLDTGIFSDVVYSAIVDWDGTNDRSSVSNEIDVVASRGIVPLFISCKACDVKTEALNELAILKDRFGGKGAKAAIVTTERCSSAARHRAAQMGITVIDLEELENKGLIERLKIIMKASAERW